MLGVKLGLLYLHDNVSVTGNFGIRSDNMPDNGDYSGKGIILIEFYQGTPTVHT